MDRPTSNRERIAVIIAMLCYACGHSPATSSSSDLTIRGRVSDFATGQGVSGIGITFGELALVTDSAGEYTVHVPIGDYVLHVDGEPTPASVLVRGTWTHGDFLAHGGNCGSRYGNVTDAVTGRPIKGAAVAVGAAVTTDADGWYRLDDGCGSCGSCNTIFITASASGYQTFTRVLGRGFRDVQRLDIPLDRAMRVASAPKMASTGLPLVLFQPVVNGRLVKSPSIP